jgi:hypothetical protein
MTSPFPIGVRTYERPGYFEKTIENLKICHDVEPSRIHVFDDCSLDPKKIELLEKCAREGMNVYYSLERLGVMRNKLRLWDTLFALDSNIICDMEDDIQINRGFIAVVERLRSIPDLGILTLHYWRGTLMENEGGYQEINYSGGPTWIVTRKFYEACADERAGPFTMESKASDHKMTRWCKEKGFTLAASIPSYVQHVGELSILYPNKNPTSCENFIGI